MIEKKAQPKRLTSRKTTAKTRQHKALPASPAEVPVSIVSDEEIALRAYALWEDRGRPVGSPDEDWHNAKTQLYSSQQS
jgi:hypothetical protein